MIELKILLEKLIKEVGELDSIESYPYKNNSFTTSEGWRVDVNFNKWNDEDLQFLDINTVHYPSPIFNVGFTVEGVESQFSTTTSLEYLKILKTVTSICYDFIRKNNPNGLTFFAANKDESKFLTTDPQKMKIYKLIVMKQLLKNNTYKLVDLNLSSTYRGFMIYKK